MNNARAGRVHLRDRRKEAYGLAHCPLVLPNYELWVALEVLSPTSSINTVVGEFVDATRAHFHIRDSLLTRHYDINLFE